MNVRDETSRGRERRMALSAGEKLGPYEILGPLGAGGMGEVYRARDSRLSREVAVKVLRGGTSFGDDAMLRLQQEARTAGALNHPNLVTVFDVGERDGSPYIVTELLNGSTLRDVLKGRALPVKKVLAFARQVADGLAAAHEHGVVHRDLKPENLFVMPDGRVKILDFGLAKRLSTDDSKAGRGQPTVPNLTEPGTILGTVGYMSPEQVRGRAVDHRSDIFSFGSVLYEMLTGRPPFLSDTSVETMSAILNADPAPIRPASGELPSGLERLVTRCLEKDPAQRFESSRDMAFHLSSLDATPTITVMTEPSPNPVARTVPRWARVAGLALAGTACALGGWLLARTKQQPEISIHQLTFRRGAIVTARFAPDGRTLVYGANWNGKDDGLHAVTMDNPESRDLPLSGSRICSVSKSGELAFLRFGPGGASTLLRAPLSGGAPRELLEGVTSADWMPDGESLAVIRTASGVSQLEVPAGTVVFRPARTNHLSYIRLSPDGSRIAFVDSPPGPNAPGRVCVSDRKGTVRILTPLLLGLVGLAWRGDEIWFSATDGGQAPWIQAVDLEGRRRTVYRQPHPLYLQDVSGARVLVLHADERSEVVVHSRDTGTTRDVAWFEYSKPVALSDDGNLLLFDESRLGGGKEGAVYLRRLDVEDPPVRLGPGRALALSPDKAWALTRRVADPGTPQVALVLLPTGPGENRVIPGDTLNAQEAVFFPDGKRLLVRGNEPGGAERLFVKDLGGGPPRPVTPEGVVVGALSRDGKRLAAKAARGPLSLYSLDTGEPPREVGGVEPDESIVRFGVTDDELFVRRRAGPVRTEVTRVDLATSRRELVATVGPMDIVGSMRVERVLMTRDARLIVTTSTKYLGELFVIEGLR